MKLGLVLTNDWELYGDGSGDYWAVQHEPLCDLLRVVEAYGAKLTVMAEVAQQWAHEEASAQQDAICEVASGWRKVLMETIRRKHDVQLHLHPQWLKSSYEGGAWNVNMEHWALTSLSAEEIEEAIKRGKKYLEELLRPVDPGYKCVAFRAGAYCIQPSKVPMIKLLDAGIICDVSVTKGMVAAGYYDFRDAHSDTVPWFGREDDIRYRGSVLKGILEIPIHSRERWYSAALHRMWPKLSYLVSYGVWSTGVEKGPNRENRVSSSSRVVQTSKSRKVQPRSEAPLWRLARRFLSKAYVQLNYDKLPAEVFTKLLEEILVRYSRVLDKDLVLPVIAIGHVKDMHNCENVEKILRGTHLLLKGKVAYWTLREAVTYWVNEGARLFERSAMR